MTTADPTSMPAAAGAVPVVDAPPIPGLSFRPAVPADWAALASVLNRARASDGLDEVRTGENLAAEWMPLDGFALERDVLVAALDGNLVGFAFGYRVVRDDAQVCETWGAVVPDHRRRGIGRALHRATRARLAAEVAAEAEVRSAAEAEVQSAAESPAHPRPGRRELRAYAIDSETGQLALLATEGYVPIRFGFEMRRFLTGSLPLHPLPRGIEMRPVTPDEHRAIFDADAEAFRDHWGHREPAEGDFVAMFHGPEVDTSLWCVAWDGDQVAGVGINAVYADENAQLGIARGWLEHVSVRRPWRGRGIARALCAASFRVLAERGATEAWLGVDGSNPTGALPLYQGLGFVVTRRWRAFGRPLEAPAAPGWLPSEGRAERPTESDP